jgi:hypothetical protein
VTSSFAIGRTNKNISRISKFKTSGQKKAVNRMKMQLIEWKIFGKHIFDKKVNN